MQTKLPFILSIVVIMNFIQGCSSTSGDWVKASSANTLSSYQQFLAEHSDSQYTYSAKVRIRKLRWESAKEKNTIESYKDFLHDFPEGTYSDEAKERLEENEWFITKSEANITSLRSFIRRYPDSRYKDDAQQMIDRILEESMIQAVSDGDAEKIRNLIRNGANTDITDDKGTPLLSISIEKGEPDVFDALLLGKPNLERTGENARTPLHMAAKFGRIREVRILLQEGAHVASYDVSLNTPLILAAVNDHAEVIKLLLDHGADIDKTNRHNLSALMLAADRGYKDVVKLLLEYGANVYLTAGREEYTAKDLALLGDHKDIAQLIGRYMLHDLAAKDDIKGMSWLVKQGVKLDITNNDGETALHVAAERNQTKAVKFLLDKGLPVDVLSRDKLTPLQSAIHSGATQAAELLLQRKAKRNLPFKDGTSMLQYSANIGDLETVEMLVRHGFNLNEIKLPNANHQVLGVYWDGYQKYLQLIKHTSWKRDNKRIIGSMYYIFDNVFKVERKKGSVTHIVALTANKEQSEVICSKCELSVSGGIIEIANNGKKIKRTEFSDIILPDNRNVLAGWLVSYDHKFGVSNLGNVTSILKKPLRLGGSKRSLAKNKTLTLFAIKNGELNQVP